MRPGWDVDDIGFYLGLGIMLIIVLGVIAVSFLGEKNKASIAKEKQKIEFIYWCRTDKTCKDLVNTVENP
jgi:hypothetical protein